MDRRLDAARRRLLRRVTAGAPADALLRETAAELLACGFTRVQLWCPQIGTLVSSQQGGLAHVQAPVAFEDVPPLLRRAVEQRTRLHEGDAVATPIPPWGDSESGVLGVEGTSLDEPAVVVLEELGAVLALGLRDRRVRAADEDADRRLHLVVERAPTPIAIFDRDMRYVAASDRYARDYGFTIGDLLGKTHYDVFPEISEAWREVHRRCLEGAVERSDGEPFVRADGSVDWVRWEVAPWRNAEGEIGGIILFSEVVTEQHRIAQALDASEARFHAIFAQAGVGIAQVEAETGRFLDVNDQSCEILGYSREELLAKHWQDVTHPDDLADDGVAMASLLRGELRSATREKRHVRKSGEMAWARVTVTRLALSTGRPSLLAMLEDVSEQKRTQDLLRESERRLATVVERSLAGMATLRLSDRKFIEVSDAFVRMLGWSREELLGRTTDDIAFYVDPEDRERAFRSLAGDGEPLHIRGRRKSGEEGHFLLTLGPVEVGGEPCAAAMLHDITALHHADVALRDNEQELRALFACAPIGIAEIDPRTGRFRRVNARLCATLGYTAEELLELSPVEDLTHPEDRPAARAAFERLGESTSEELHSEKRCTRKDGSTVWISLVTTSVRDPEGNLIGVLAAIKDIDERRRAEAALLLHQSALRAAANAVVITDARARIQNVNPAFTKLTGYTEEEALGRNPNLLRSGLQDRAFYQEMWKTILSGKVWRGELLNRRKDGSVYFEDMTITPLFDERGVLVNFVAIKQDVTDRKRVETELRESEERYRTLVDNLEDVVFSLDESGRMTFVNQAISVFGYRPEDVLGRSAEAFLHEEDRAIFHSLWATPHDSPARELRVVDAGGKMRPVRMRLRPYRIGSRAAGASGVAVDLTARREIEEQLRASQKMEAVGRLAGGVAHDFNNLLSVILSYTELAVGDLHEGDPLRADLGEVLEAGHRAEGLTRQLLAFSRKQLLAPEALDLNELIGKIARMLGRLIGEDVALEIVEGVGLPRTKVDRGQMEQVLMNLVVNARDAMPEGGRLSITTRAVAVEGAEAHALELPPGDYVELAVADTGVGMDEEGRSRVFEPFFTTKGPGKGTGLGLSMVFGIVRQSGGAVTVESSKGAGSKFRILLPRHAAETPLPIARQTSRHPDRGHECVLVVEDEGALRAVIRRVLASAGYEVLLASGAEEAMAHAEKHGRRIRLILTDVIMPVMSGRELASRLVPLCPSARVVFMSGYTDEAIERFGVLDAEFLRKPFDLRILTDRVRAVLDAQPA